MTIQCPGCKSYLQVGPETAGKIVECARCHQQMQVPAVPVAALVQEPPRQQPAADGGMSSDTRVVLGCGLGCLGVFLLALLLFFLVMIRVVDSLGELSPVQNAVEMPRG